MVNGIESAASCRMQERGGRCMGTVKSFLLFRLAQAQCHNGTTVSEAGPTGATKRVTAWKHVVSSLLSVPLLAALVSVIAKPFWISLLVYLFLRLVLACGNTVLTFILGVAACLIAIAGVIFAVRGVLALRGANKEEGIIRFQRSQWGHAILFFFLNVAVSAFLAVGYWYSIPINEEIASRSGKRVHITRSRVMRSILEEAEKRGVLFWLSN